MNLEKINLLDTNLYHSLISDYLSSKDQLESFVRDFPDENVLIKYAQEKTFNQSKRDTLCSALNNQYSGVLKSEALSRNLELIQDPNTFTITTGHQLCLATGPMYFIVKICSTIALCNHLKSLAPEMNFAPIYWLASEDHDFEEINHFKVFSKTYAWSNSQDGAVGRMSLEGIEIILNELEEQLGEGFNRSELLEILKQAYAKKDLSTASRFLVDKLFGNHGLVIIDGDDKQLKNEFITTMKRELLEKQTHEFVNQSINELKASSYKIQVNPRKINLFYLEDQARNRIVYSNGVFGLPHQENRWSKSEILEELEAHPERFSPNVILRPMYQELILPNLAYIGGGGEISYWLELKSAFEYHKIDFPILLVRDSLLIINNSIQKKIEKLKLSHSDLFLPLEQLSIKVLPEDDQLNIEKYRKDISKVYMDLMNEVSNLDKSLTMSVDSEKTKTMKGLDNLDKKIIRSFKRKNEELIKQLEAIKEKLFPNGGLQERQVNYIQFYLEFGEELIPTLIQQLNPINKELLLISKNLPSSLG